MPALPAEREHQIRRLEGQLRALRNDRRKDMRRRRRAGQTFQEIGDDYGLTAGRIHQILNGNGATVQR